ncbi:glyceraldehyde-3-phosphate dehydrogenase (NADP+) [Spiroplasma sp. TIUS-1]|uniref:NADP-dependent glyceraldehyde-3-phosphate dehydrogenase n=1 Tax=Spiroplasma sp. TIUS-1 TaxID=216963 RepID=UPI001398FF9A|nr:NADP-dependent glyceraldehyde-3-phosphate dehydrogenase [Spiroplasma sp. TIUS-1]QHX35804.1 glyceraldehyde-3-phosphate dehydrogenase (NADP+) [Spiroplasma sp. TIUS-1]
MNFNAMINNEFVSTTNKLEILNPVDNKVIGTVSALQEEDINNAYSFAKSAQKEWANMQLMKRIEVVEKFKQEIIKNKEKIAEIMMAEIAKPLKESVAEVQRTIDIIDFSIEEIRRFYPTAMDGKGWGIENKIGVFERVPVGVVCAISPFNYPFNLAIAKIVPALLAGNSVVFKPATQGSLTGAFMGKMWVDSKLPKGIFNVVTGKGRDIGDIIVSNKDINMISFTGSVNVGHRIRKMANTSNIVLELGGKDAALVLDDKNLDHYVSEIISGSFGYAGQRCTAIKRVLTTNEIAEKLVPLLEAKIKMFKHGNPKTNPDIVPVISESSRNFIMGLVEDAKARGGKIVTGGSFKGNLVEATLIDNVTSEMRIAWEEPFGPVLPVIRCKNVDEMISMQNESNFGLQSSIFTTDINLAFNIAKLIEVGTVNINSRPQRGPDNFPFLGIKDSGEGVQGIRESLNSMTRYKGIVINWK